MSFGNSPEKLKNEYLDVYEGVYLEVISTDKFHEDTDISPTYLGQVDMTINTEVKAEENFPMTARDYTRCHLLDGTDCDVLIDTGMSKSYMSKSFFYNASYCTQCQNLLLPHKEFKLVMDNI